MNDADLFRKLEKLQDSFVQVAQKESDGATRSTSEFSKLLMQIAFASIGLISIKLIDTDVCYFLKSRIGLVALVFSIIFGAVQLLIDRQFSIRNSQLAITVADKIGLHLNNADELSRAMDMRNAFNDYARTARSSNLTPLVIQSIFVTCGATLILLDVLF